MVEFRRLLIYGFLEGLCLFSSVFESQIRRAGLTCAELEALEKEEEEKAKARKNIDPRDCTWSGMVQDTCRDDSRPRYQDYRDSVVAIVTDVVRFRSQATPQELQQRQKPLGHQNSHENKLLVTHF